jgi:hypothetical protein
MKYEIEIDNNDNKLTSIFYENIAALIVCILQHYAMF